MNYTLLRFEFTRSIFLCLLVALLFGAPSAFAQDCGEVVGARGFTPAGAFTAELVATADDQLYAAYVDTDSPTNDLIVETFDGTNWVQLGPVVGSVSSANSSSIALTVYRNSFVLVAYPDATRSGNLFAKFYDPGSNAWGDLGADGISFTPGEHPAFFEHPATNQLLLAAHVIGEGAHVFEFDLSADFWSPLGILSSNPVHEFAWSYDVAADQIGLSYMEEATPGEYVLRVGKYESTGGVFTSLGDPVGDLGVSRPFQFTYDFELTPEGATLAYGGVDPFNILAARYDGSMWNQLGMGAEAPRGTDGPELLYASGQLYLSAAERDPDAGFGIPLLQYLDGDAWYELCPGASGYSQGSPLALAASDSSLYSVAVDYSGPRSLTVYAFDLEPVPPTPVDARIDAPQGTDLSCSTPLLDLFAVDDSGQTTLDYAWSTGEFGSVIQVDAAGTYSVTITNYVTGLSDMASVTITESPADVSIDASATELTPAQPTVTLTASIDGSLPSATTEYVWSTGETTQTIAIDAAGNYSVTVRSVDPDDDIEFCSGQASVTITGSGASLVEALIVTPDGTELSCERPFLLLDGTDSSGPSDLTYSWSSGETDPAIIAEQPGTYTLTVASASTGESDQVSVTLTEVDLIIAIDPSATELSAAVPSITLTATGSGFPADALVEIAWSTGESTPSITVDEAGVYDLTVTFTSPDGTYPPCIGSDAVTITDVRAPQVEAVILSPLGLTLDCLNESVLLDASESTGPAGLTYAWSTGETTDIISVDAPGDYSVVVTDPVGGNSDVAMVTITLVETLVAIQASTTELTTAQPTATLEALVVNAPPTARVDVLWSTGETTSQIVVDQAGTYSVVLRYLDPNDGFEYCRAAATIDIVDARGGDPDCARLAVSNDVLTCIEPVATLDASGSASGAADRMFVWSTGSTEASISVTQPGTYVVIVSAPSQACLDTASVVVEDQRSDLGLVIDTPEGTSVGCEADALSLIANAAAVPDATLRYAWSTGDSSGIIVVEEAGDYSVVAIDDDTQCTDTATVNVRRFDDAIVASTFLVDAEFCAGDSVRLIDYTLANALPDALEFEWDFGDGGTSSLRDPVHVYGAPGSYEVSLQVSANGCASDVLRKQVSVRQCLRLGVAQELDAYLAPSINTGSSELHIKLAEVSDVLVELIDVTGHVLHQATYQGVLREVIPLDFPHVGQFYIRVTGRTTSTTLWALVIE